jgi:hypothetical protein
MISKPIPANSFYHTSRYVCQKKGAEVLIAEGVRGHDYKLMAEDCLRQQRTRPSKGNAVFHSILSFHPDEKPSDEMLKEIARKYLDRLGIVNTQFAVSKHTDKSHLHLHIIANLVDNTGKAISNSKGDYFSVIATPVSSPYYLPAHTLPYVLHRMHNNRK